MRILWAIFGIKMYALWYLHPSAKTKKTKAAALPMNRVPTQIQSPSKIRDFNKVLTRIVSSLLTLIIFQKI